MKRFSPRALWGAALSAVLISFTLALAPALAAQWDIPTRVSQGHAFPVSVTDDAPFTATFLWRGETLAVTASPQNTKKGSVQKTVWKAELLLAMPIDAGKPYPLSVTAAGQSRSFSIMPLRVAWPQSILKVAPKYVEPPREVQEQIARDSRRSRQALALRTEKRWTLPLARPVPGGITSVFGGRRVFNGQPRAPHAGTDMRCAEGTPVKAAADGTVIFAESTYFGGNMVYIDHGQGVVSTYAHLSSFDVKAGQGIRRGQAIGRSGSTGRVTGPHLHFGLMVQGVAVDAMPLLKSPPPITGGPSRSLFDTQPKPAKAGSSR